MGSKTNTVMRGFGWRRRVLTVLALSALGAYCGWWLFWLVQGSLPPAPLLAMTGLPAPTTGYTRSLCCAFDGDFASSFLYNAFALPISLLLATSVVWIGVRAVRRQTVRLPACFLHLWVITLSAAWITKLMGDPCYW